MTGQVTIVGAGVAATVLDATGLSDRALSIASGAGVRLRRLTITGGHPRAAAAGSPGAENLSCTAGGSGNDGGAAGSGGGIYNRGTLTLDAVAVTRNTAGSGGAGGAGGAQSAGGGCSGGNGGPGGSGGGIYNLGRLTVVASTIRDNRAGPGGAGGQGGAGTLAGGVGGVGGLGGSGGGVSSAHGTLAVTNSTFAGNLAGTGGRGGPAGNGGAGGSGGAIQVTTGASRLLNDTVADNGVGPGGVGGSPLGRPGNSGSGGGLVVQSSTAADDMRLQNTIVASNIGSQCAASTGSAIANGGHDLSYGDRTCPGEHANPKLGALRDNGGPTPTMALRRGSRAIGRVPANGGHCPPTDQRGIHRPQGKRCDIGAFEFALPTIEIISPVRGGSYERGSRVLARFRCLEGGISSPIATCKAKVRSSHRVKTRSLGRKSFKVTATDKSGNKVSKTVHYKVWAYTNPLRAVGGLFAGRIDMGVDYGGGGSILALGDGKVTMASNHDSGPPSCWGISCWPGGGIVVYRLLDGPFAGKYIYVAENITATVSAGQRVKAGQQIAIAHNASPHMETGWASGRGAETLAFADGHQCTCGDPGGWSAIEGRNFDALLIFVGAPSGYLQPNPPNQSMPRGWPRLPPRAAAASIPQSSTPMSEGAAPHPK